MITYIKQLNMEIIKMLLLVIIQNASFTLVSRARNSPSIVFHGLSSVLSNGIWLLVIRKVTQSFDKPELMITYLVGSVIGSLGMHYISMHHIEKRLKK